MIRKKIYGLLVISVLFASLSVHAQRWIYPKPQGNHLTVVKVIPGTHDLLAAGYNATLMRSHDGGHTWRIQYHIAGQIKIMDMALIDSTHWYLITSEEENYKGTVDSSILLKTMDAGKSWTTIKLHATPSIWSYNYSQIEFLNKDTGFISAAYDTVLRTLDGGLTWKNVDIFSAAIHPGGLMHFSNIHTGTLIKTTDTTWFTSNGGKKWFRYTNSGFSASSLFFTSPRVGYAVGGYVRKTIDSGKTWFLYGKQDSSIWSWLKIYFFNSSTAYGIGCGKTSGFYFMRSTDSGYSWKKVAVHAGVPNSIAFITKDSGIAVGDYGNIWYTYDGGQNWEAGPNDFYYTATSIDFWDSVGYMGTQNGLLRTEDYGNHWQNASSNLPIYQVVATGPTHAYATMRYWNSGSFNAMSPVRIMKTTNAGKSWDTIYAAPLSYYYIKRISFPDDTTGYAIIDWGTVLKTTDGGKSWKRLNINMNTKLADVFFVTDSLGFVLGDEIRKTTDGGKSWSNIVIPSKDISYHYFSRIYFINKNTGFAIGDDYVWKTSDGGNTWSAQTNFLGIYSDIHFIKGGKYGYIVGSRQYLTTTDSGNTWVQNIYPYYHEAYSVYPLNKQHIYIGGMDYLLDMSSDTVTLPIASFSYSTNCSGTVYFNNSSSYSQGSLSYQWDFGDSSTSTLAWPRHTFKKSGTYTVKLLATGSDGTTANKEVTVTVTITANNALSFTFSQPSHSSPTVRFSPSDSNYASYKWYFGDGDSSSLKSPSHTYVRKDTTYTVRLITRATQGCTDTVIKKVSVTYTGINEQTANAVFNIYPNPAADALYIEQQNGKLNASISLYSEDGKEVLHTNWQTTTPDNKKTIDISALRPGIYMLMINSATAHYSQKVIIER